MNSELNTMEFVFYGRENGILAIMGPFASYLAASSHAPPAAFR
jgi:hypothetical protein